MNARTNLTLAERSLLLLEVTVWAFDIRYGLPFDVYPNLIGTGQGDRLLSVIASATTTCKDLMVRSQGLIDGKPLPTSFSKSRQFLVRLLPEDAPVVPPDRPLRFYRRAVRYEPLPVTFHQEDREELLALPLHSPHSVMRR